MAETYPFSVPADRAKCFATEEACMLHFDNLIYFLRQIKQKYIKIASLSLSLPPLSLSLGSCLGVMGKVPQCSLEVSEFKFKLHCYVHFRTNTFVKGMNTLIPLVVG